jgi:branched-chain amino acid transport system permease protein
LPEWRAPSFVVIVMAFRKGPVGELTEWWKRRTAPQAEKAAD